MQQRTDEWLKVRLGKATASRVADIVAKTKSGYAASRKNYAAQLVCERLTGQPQDSFTNAAMQWGTETEPQARNAYCFHRDADVTECAFFDHPVIGMSGASPDGATAGQLHECRDAMGNGDGAAGPQRLLLPPRRGRGRVRLLRSPDDRNVRRIT
jgi:hypothetical protein